MKYITDVDYVVNDWVGGFSPFERDVIFNYSKGKLLHLFSGNSDIGIERIDLNPNSNATIKIDVFEFIKTNKKQFNTILLDPIYCHEERVEIWKEKYGNLKDLYVYPYDSRKTKILFDWFKNHNPEIIILKSMDVHQIPGFDIIQGYIIEVGAFKPNRTLVIYRSKSKGFQKTLFSSS